MAGPELQNRWVERVPRASCEAGVRRDAAAAGMTHEEMECLRWWYRTLVFEVVERVAALRPAHPHDPALQPVVAATACVLWSAFTHHYSILSDVHAEVLVCAVVNMALKLHHHRVPLEAVITAWRGALAGRVDRDLTKDAPRRAEALDAVNGYAARLGDSQIVGCVEFYLIGALGVDVHVVHPFAAADKVLRRCRAAGLDVHGAGGDALATATRDYIYQAALTDMPLYTPPSIMALVAVERAYLRANATPPPLETLLEVIGGPTPATDAAEVAAVRTAFCAARRDFAEGWQRVQAVPRGRHAALAEAVRARALADIPQPEGA